MLYIYIFILLFNLQIYGDVIRWGGNYNWKNCEIINGKIVYIPDKGNSIKIAPVEEAPDRFTELFLNFNNEKPYLLKDETGNYKILKSVYYINPELKFQNTLTAGFLKPHHIIKIKVSKNNLWSTPVDLGNFTIDFWLYPTLLNDCKLFYKGIYHKGKFYGIKIWLKNKKIIAQFLNMFYDSENRVYSINLKSSAKLSKYEWQHIAVTFERQAGKLSLYINGKANNVRFATTTGKGDDEILVPHFLKIDGSDFIIGENFFGYLDNFRISNIARKNFQLTTTKIKEKAIIISKVMDLKYFYSVINKIKFEFSNITDTVSKIYLRGANKKFNSTDNSPDWQIISLLNNDTIEISDFPRVRFIQWKVELYPTPLNISPTLNFVQIIYTANVPPEPPQNLNAAISGPNSVKLEWTQNQEEDIMGYIIYWGTSSRNYENKLDVGLCNSYIIELPEKGIYYFFAITAYDSTDPYNESRFSKEVRIYLK